MKLLLLLPILFLVSCVSDPKYRIEKPFLYQVSKDSKVGYLFGTMHSSVVIEDLPKSFWPYFDQADIFVSESSDQDAKDFQKELEQRYVRGEKDLYLAEKLKPELFSRVSVYLKKHYSKEAEAILQEGSLFALYSVVMQSQDLNQVEVTYGEYVRLKGRFQLDRKLEQKAGDQSKVIDHLDSKTYRDITKCLTSQDEKYIQEIDAVVSGRLERKNTLTDELALARTYRSGNADAIRNLKIEIDECLLKDRNRLWIPKMISIFDAYEKPFFAVGVAHIEAKDGSLYQLLTAQGFKVERVEEYR
jgi:uncharacterized protein YbaP (TraB family)